MIAYKQCDLEFDCDSCSLDDVMRRQSAVADEPPLSSLHSDHAAEGAGADETPSRRFERQLEEFFQPLGAVQLPDDRLYHRCHMWVKDEGDSSATIGIDHVGAYFLQPVVSVVLPQTPSKIESKSPCTWLVLREGTIALRSAIRGIATEANAILVDRPYLLLDDPYDSGWMLKVSRGAEKKREGELLSAAEFSPIYLKEIGVLKDRFAASFRRAQPVVGATMHDGGEPVRTVQEVLGKKKYFELINRIFLKA